MRRFLAVVAAASLALFAPGAARADDQDSSIGQLVYQQLSDAGVIVARPNPLYDVLDPIAKQIKSVADEQYTYPFNFIIIHDTAPNAFAAPGGNVYVTDATFGYVSYREQFTGILCHEVAHDIDHDLVHSIGKDQQLATLIGLVGAFSGRVKSARGLYTENLAYALQANNYDLAVEGTADLKGADICAEAGYNPWGMVWLFENAYKGSAGGTMEALSDPISQRHRIAALQAHFAENPQLFGAYPSNGATAKALMP